MKGLRLTLAAVFLLGAARTGDAGFDWKKVDPEKALSGAGKVAKAAAGLSDADEEALGEEVAAYLCARYGLLRDSALTRYVQLTGHTVARRAGRPNVTYRFAVLDTDEVNAYAAPGGYIFVTKGLLRFIENEAELAAALAHEVAHVAHRHAAKAVRKANLLEGGVELASAAKDSPALKGASDFTIHLLFQGFSRKDEEEADAAGLDYALAAGYPASGLEMLLDRLAGQKTNQDRFKALGKSHPPASERVKTVRRRIAARNPDGKGPLHEARFRTATAALRRE
jgi:beta-barrel assembly-enhancing protease